MIKILHRHNMPKFGEWIYLAYTPEEEIDGDALRTLCEELGGRILGAGGMMDGSMRDIDYCFGEDTEAATKFVEQAVVLLGGKEKVVTAERDERDDGDKETASIQGE